MKDYKQTAKFFIEAVRKQTAKKKAQQDQKVKGGEKIEDKQSA